MRPLVLSRSTGNTFGSFLLNCWAPFVLNPPHPVCKEQINVVKTLLLSDG